MHKFSASMAFQSSETANFELPQKSITSLSFKVLWATEIVEVANRSDKKQILIIPLIFECNYLKRKDEMISSARAFCSSFDRFPNFML